MQGILFYLQQCNFPCTQNNKVDNRRHSWEDTKSKHPWLHWIIEFTWVNVGRNKQTKKKHTTTIKRQTKQDPLPHLREIRRLYLLNLLGNIGWARNIANNTLYKTWQWKLSFQMGQVFHVWQNYTFLVHFVFWLKRMEMLPSPRMWSPARVLGIFCFKTKKQNHQQ